MNPQEQPLDAQEDLQEESLGQRMTGIARGEAEHQPRGQDIDGIDKQCRPVLLGVYPFNDLIDRLIVECKRQDPTSGLPDRAVAAIP